MEERDHGKGGMYSLRKTCKERVRWISKRKKKSPMKHTCRITEPRSQGNGVTGTKGQK